jgi:hypothetical protein
MASVDVSLSYTLIVVVGLVSDSIARSATIARRCERTPMTGHEKKGLTIDPIPKVKCKVASGNEASLAGTVSECRFQATIERLTPKTAINKTDGGVKSLN